MARRYNKSKGIFHKQIKFDDVQRNSWGVIFYWKGKHVFTINNHTKKLFID